MLLCAGSMLLGSAFFSPLLEVDSCGVAGRPSGRPLFVIMVHVLSGLKAEGSGYGEYIQ